MARKDKVKSELKGKVRLRSEIVEAVRGLHKIGAIGVTVTVHSIDFAARSYGDSALN